MSFRGKYATTVILYLFSLLPSVIKKLAGWLSMCGGLSQGTNHMIFHQKFQVPPQDKALLSAYQPVVSLHNSLLNPCFWGDSVWGAVGTWRLKESCNKQSERQVQCSNQHAGPKKKQKTCWVGRQNTLWNLKGCRFLHVVWMFSWDLGRRTYIFFGF